MSKYTDKNWEKIAAKMKSQQTSLANVSEVKKLADDIYDWAITYSGVNTWNSGIPVFTGNLLDSFGIGIYLNGTLIGLSMEGQKYADITQSYKGQEYWGRDKLNDALNQTSNIGSGLVMRIFSASPISEMINEEGSSIGRGISFFDRIVEYATNEAKIRFGLQ